MLIRETYRTELENPKAMFRVRVIYTEGAQELAYIFEHLGVPNRVFDRILTRSQTLPIHAPANTDIEIVALRRYEDSDSLLLRVEARSGREAEEIVKNLL